MPKPALAVLAVILGVIAGCVLSALIYAIVVGILSEIGGGSEAVSSSLWQRAWAFAMTFGLVTGARWGLSVGYRNFGTKGQAALVVKVASVAVLILAVLLLLVGDRWNTTFGGLGFATVPLVVLWLTLTWGVARAIEGGRPKAVP